MLLVASIAAVKPTLSIVHKQIEFDAQEHHRSSQFQKRLLIVASTMYPEK
jgi:hypothetical protein